MVSKLVGPWSSCRLNLASLSHSIVSLTCLIHPRVWLSCADRWLQGSISPEFSLHLWLLYMTSHLTSPLWCLKDISNLMFQRWMHSFPLPALFNTHPQLYSSVIFSSGIHPSTQAINLGTILHTKLSPFIHAQSFTESCWCHCLCISWIDQRYNFLDLWNTSLVLHCAFPLACWDIKMTILFGLGTTVSHLHTFETPVVHMWHIHIGHSLPENLINISNWSVKWGVSGKPPTYAGESWDSSLHRS